MTKQKYFLLQHLSGSSLSLFNKKRFLCSCAGNLRQIRLCKHLIKFLNDLKSFNKPIAPVVDFFEEFFQIVLTKSGQVL